MNHRHAIVGVVLAAALMASAAARAESPVAEQSTSATIAMSDREIPRTQGERNGAPSDARISVDHRETQRRHVALNAQATPSARPSSPVSLVDPRECGAVLQTHMVFVPPSF